MPELLEERQAKVEATLEQIDRRLSNVEVSLRDLNNSLSARIDNLSISLNARTDALNPKIDTNFRWIIGMWVTTILAIITTIFTILLKG